MTVNINSVHFKTDKKLDDFISDKVAKLTHIFDGVITSEVTLKLDSADRVKNKVVEIRLAIRGNDLFARKESKSFEEATDLAVDALRTQLTRYKEKIKGI